MHHGIMIKVRANDVEDAKKQADKIMEDTMACSKCSASKQNVNWDSFHLFDIVDEKFIVKYRSELKGVKTVEDLVNHYLNLREVNLKYCEKQVRDELKRFNAQIKKTRKIPKFSMIGFYLDKLDSIRSVIGFRDDDNGLYTLHCTENHYADMTEYTKGDKAYYLWYDRHY
jgi:hypothetical protein